jgi:hypothetical protein
VAEAKEKPLGASLRKTGLRQGMNNSLTGYGQVNGSGYKSIRKTDAADID